MDHVAIRQWLSALESISYYDIFGVPKAASFDELRVAFHTFAEGFHPDVHQWRAPSELAAINYIFKRGTEAYRVLSDPSLRSRYDEALAAGILRPEQIIVELEGPKSKSMAPNSGRLIDKVRSAGARPFVVRAEELLKKGDPKQAKIQLVMAMHMDAKNAALEAFAKELDEAIKAKADEEKRNWKK